jgi:hypothetical protein
MEQLNLTTAETIPQAITSSYKVITIGLYWEQQYIVICLRGDNGKIKQFTYGGLDANATEKTKAANLMIALNKANLSTISLQKRILNQLISDGLISGTVTGVVD